MKNSTSPIKILRAALLLLTLLLPAAAAMATDFITDVMVVGHSDQTAFNSLISSYVSAGWTDIPQDLNQGCGSSSDYIHLLYKTQSSQGNTGTPITGFYIRTSKNPPDNLTHEGRTYYLVPCQGSTNFVEGHGDLNNHAGGDYIFLYYTKDVLSNNHGVTDIFFNTTQSGAVGANGGTTGYDLNTGCGSGSAYIYMHLSTATGGNVVTLTSGSGDVQLLNGHVLTGTGGTDTRVSVADGATVTLSGVNHTAITNNSSHSWPGIHCSGNATIVLNGGTTNSVSGGYRSPGIYVAANKTLTIQGSGTLTATGRDFAAGIGSGKNQSSCGNIILSGGTVTATGGQNASGIGSGHQSSCGNITISGGTVNATGLTYASGIGSGYENASCGTITISSGTVTAAGGLYAAAIGSGYQSSCGTITITNGVTCVTATKHNNSAYSVGASNNGSSVTVTVGGVQTGSIQMSPFVTYPYTVRFDSNGGTGTMANQAFMYNVAQNLTGSAFSNTGRGFMGWATSAAGPKVYNDGQSVSNLTQSAGGTVTLYAKWGKTVTLTSSTGEVVLQDGDTLTGTGGSSTRVKIADGATVTFSGVDNTAITLDETHQWPGIDCLGNATIVLKGGTTNSVSGGFQSPGIHVAENKTLTIQGSGTLNATGSMYAAGIGSGYQSSCGDIILSGGTVTAAGGLFAAGIGSGHDNASCGDITITNGVTRVTATKNFSNNSVGAGLNSSCGTVTIDGVTGFITKSPFVTYPYTVHFDANGGTGAMTNQALMNDVAQTLTANAFSRVGWAFQGWATSATGPKVYDDGQSVSHLTETSGATVTLYANWMFDPNHFSVDGDIYTIQSETGWDVFCDLLAENSNGYFTGKTVKLADNISVTTMAGSSGHEFSGTFNGQGHTLNVDYQSTDGAVRAPFSYVDGATIQNLVVAGSIPNTGNPAAGIVGETGSSLSHITNCVSSVNVSGGDYTAGISMGGKVEITGCVFNGKITGTGISAGFVGSYNSALVINNSLFASQAGSSINGGTFYNGSGEITPVIVNSYYTTPLGTSQGKQAHSIVGGEHVTVAFHGQATAYNTSGISAYNVGMVYGSTLYAGDGETVSLNLSCTPPTGYVLSGYTVNNGTLTGEANPYTLEIGNSSGEVIIEAVLLPTIAYIDGDGKTHIRVGYTVLTGGGATTLTEGWYVVNDNITYTGTLTLIGDVTLILCNGKTMTVATDSGNSINGFINWESTFALTVYGQTLDSNTAGTLHVTNYDEDKNAIEVMTYTQHSGNVVVIDSNDEAIFARGDFTLNGGTFNATGDDYGIVCTNLTLNGGTVNATANDEGIYVYYVTINGGTVNATGFYGIYAEGDVTLNSGTVNATTNISGGYGIFANGDIILGWTNTNDYILVSRYEAGGTVSVKSGQAFYYEDIGKTVLVSDTLNSNQINAIGGKTLRPLTPVSYVDGDGETHTCFEYTMLRGGGATTLAEGWYVVDRNIIYTGTLTLEGNVTLILCNGKTMTVNPGSGNSISGLALTVYGQTLDPNTAGTLFVTNDVENNSAIDLITYTQHSGKVVVSDLSDYAILADGDFTLNGGTVNTTGRNGIDANNVTINGGIVNATGSQSGIFAQFDIILGWTNTINYIHVSSYQANGTVSVKSGQAFYYQNGIDTVMVSGMLNSDQINAIGGKTLHPFAPVSYMDGNGETHNCFEYTVLKGGGATTLTEGWYVVDHDISYNNTLTLAGDVNLILCNGKTMTVNPESGNSIYGLSSTVGFVLTVYGQTLDSNTAGTFYVTNYVASKSAIDLSTYTQHSGNVVVIDSRDPAMAIWTFTLNGGTVNATGSYGIFTHDVTINGGTVNANGSNGIVGDLTINGGTVNANGNNCGLYGGNMTINGGTLNANGNDGIHANNVTINGGTVTTNKIISPTTTLGWSNLTDYITVGSFIYHSGEPTVSVKSGQAFYYIGEDSGDKNVMDTVVISGTLTTGEIAAIAGKTLRPYIEPCTPPFHLEVADIGATTATLHWMGVQDSYIVRYRTAGRAGEWVEATADTTTLNITGLVPETEYEWEVQGVDCDGNGGTTEWSEIASFTTEELTTVTQSIELVEGWNWISTFIELDDPVALLQLLENGLGDSGVQIESVIDGVDMNAGEEWAGDLMSIGLMNEHTYMIEVTEDVTVELQGPATNPADHPITIYPGEYSWIGFPCAEEVDVNVALAGFEAEDGDMIETVYGDEGGIIYYYGGMWVGDFDTMIPGRGYIYFSNSDDEKTLIFQTGEGAKANNH